jgi:hypothetical protein
LIDVPLAIAALELYRDTVQSHQPNNLVRLVLLLYLSIQDNDSARSAVLMNILSEVPEHKVVLSPTENGLDVLTWQSLVSISFAFLSFSRTDAYRSALNLLRFVECCLVSVSLQIVFPTFVMFGTAKCCNTVCRVVSAICIS